MVKHGKRMNWQEVDQHVLEQRPQGVQQLGVGDGRGQLAAAESEEGMVDLQCRIAMGQTCQN